MEASELMIGDWVYIKDYPMIKSPQRIRPEHFVRSLVDFEPIPLTPEILEKNGFMKQEDGCFRYFKSYDENYYFGFESISYLFERKTAKITKEHSQSGLQERVEFTCEYLHELQHALRLCGIEKTIEL